MPFLSVTNPYFELSFHDTSINPLHSIIIKLDYKRPNKLVTLSKKFLLVSRQLKPLYIKDNLIYYLKQVTSICQLGILYSVVNNILVIAHEKGYSGFL